MNQSEKFQQQEFRKLERKNKKMSLVAQYLFYTLAMVLNKQLEQNYIHGVK